MNLGASHVALVVKTHLSMLEMEETQIRSLGQENPLEEGMANHSIIFAWKIPWTTVHGVAKSWTQLNNNSILQPNTFLYLILLP